MKWILIIWLVLLAGCYVPKGQSMNLEPVVEAVAPAAFTILVPTEPWRSIGLMILAAIASRKIKK